VHYTQAMEKENQFLRLEVEKSKYSKDKEGYSSVIVVDQNIANNTAESSIKVVFPALLERTVSVF
jgi:hypothetical protein